jgi:hypothetical protein
MKVIHVKIETTETTGSNFRTYAREAKDQITLGVGEARSEDKAVREATADAIEEIAQSVRQGDEPSCDLVIVISNVKDV